MRWMTLILAVTLIAGCNYGLPLYTPDVQVRPEVVGHSDNFSVRLWGAEIADYRFMGAVEQSEGGWEVRLDPVWLGVFSQESRVSVQEGDILPLGPGPAVRVQFVSISPTEITLRAIDVHTPGSRY